MASWISHDNILAEAWEIDVRDQPQILCEMDGTWPSCFFWQEVQKGAVQVNDTRSRWRELSWVLVMHEWFCICYAFLKWRPPVACWGWSQGAAIRCNRPGRIQPILAHLRQRAPPWPFIIRGCFYELLNMISRNIFNWFLIYLVPWLVHQFVFWNLGKTPFDMFSRQPGNQVRKIFFAMFP